MKILKWLFPGKFTLDEFDKRWGYILKYKLDTKENYYSTKNYCLDHLQKSDWL